MMSWTRYSISSKKGIQMALSKLMSYIIIIVVFLVLVGIIFQQPLKELVTSFADSKLNELENRTDSAQGGFNNAVVDAKRLENNVDAISSIINTYSDDTDCLIPFKNILQSFDSYSEGATNDISVFFSKSSSGEISLQFSRSSLDDSGSISFPLDKIDSVNLITDAVPILSSSGIPASNLIQIIKTVNSDINPGLGYYDTIDVKDGSSSKFGIVSVNLPKDNIFPVFVQGEFSSELGAEKYLLKTHILKVGNNLFFYNGDSADWFGRNNVLPESISISQNSLCEVNT
jgi:hypothetical protein